MSTEKPIGVQGLLGYKLKKTQHALRLCMDEALKNIEITTPQYAVLAQAELKPNISNAELARSAFITAQTMHAIVLNLEKRKLIKRNQSLEHKRVLGIELSPEGQKVVSKAHEIIRQCESHMLRTISKEHQILLERLLFECFSNLQNHNPVLKPTT